MIRYGMILGWLAVAVFGLVPIPAAPAQELPAANGAAEVADTPEGRKLASLKSLVESMAGTVVEVDKLRAELKQTVSEERKAELNARIEALDIDIARLQTITQLNYFFATSSAAAPGEPS